MSRWILIPVSPLGEGKSRLAEVLMPTARRTLNERFLRHVLDQSVATVGERRVIVVSRSDAVRRIAATYGAQSLSEGPERDLNAALTLAGRRAIGHGAEAALVVPTDLPLLTAGDLQAVLRAVGGGPGLAIAPDRTAQGTNALLTAPVDAIGYRFGEHSYAAHLDEARSRGLPVAEIDRPGLAFDVDTPDDYRELESQDATLGFTADLR